MRGKSKLLAAGLVAACALTVCAGVITSASAQVGGHFTVDVQNATFKATESPTHRLEFVLPGLKGIICNELTYPLGKAPQTFTEFVILLGTRACHTTGGDPGEIEIRGNSCGINFKIGKSAAEDNTTDIYCFPGGGPIEVFHPNCTIKVPAQTGFSGATYTKVVENSKHALTVELTLATGGTEVVANYEGGICVFLGTAHSMIVIGSLTVKALDGNDAAANLTATGSG